MNLVCNFSACDIEFPFTEGKLYEIYDKVKGFNHLSGHILSDNGRSVKVETRSVTTSSGKQWVVKDYRSYSKFVNYASFSVSDAMLEARK